MKRLAGRRAALAIALAGAAATTMGASRCGTASGGSVTVSGSRLTVYASAPAGVPAALATDVTDAERLAFDQLGARVGGFTVTFRVLHGKPSDNARTAIQDKTAIAYLGELEPGASAGTIGITNDQDLLQLSPTDTALELTQSTPAVAGAPGDYYEAEATYGRTFARVVPSGAAEARAQVRLMGSLHVRRLYVTDDGSAYGRAIAYAVGEDARASGLRVVRGPAAAASVGSSGADALFYGAVGGAGWLGALGGRVEVFLPSALASSALPAGAYVSQPGFAPAELTPAAKRRFLAPFEAAYGHAPATEAIFGYEAMAAVLGVLREAATAAGNRATVVHDFFAIKNRPSVLGTYSIDSNGDPTIAPFLISRVRDGALWPWRFIRLAG